MLRFSRSLLIGLFLSVLPLAVGQVPPAAAADPGPQPDLPSDVPADWWSQVQRSTLLVEYAVVAEGPSGTDFRAVNPAHRFEAHFDAGGLRLAPTEGANWEWGLSLTRWGRPGALDAADVVWLSADEDRIELDRRRLTEWFVNRPDGLEHGFTVPVPPRDDGERLVFDLALAGGLRPVFAEDGQAIDFFSNGDVSVLRYAKLAVTDAAGAVVPAWMEPIAGGIRIVVEDSRAIYPITVDPLATSASWTASGEAVGDRFAYSVATAGDVNGDGYSDVIVGAYNKANSTGKTYLYLGGPSGLSANASWAVSGEAEGSQFGGSVATAGDVNGDGYSDVVVAASGNTGDTGKAYLYLGGASGLSASASWTAVGEATGDRFGGDVATAGDVNGDGYSDVVVGAEGNNSDTGKAYLYLGGASGLSASASWTAAGEAGNDEFGRSVATAGDVNGDGYSDVVVGAEGNNSDTGKAYLYLGGAGVNGLSEDPSWTAVGGATSSSFGWSVATAGDVNGDGYSDVVVGAKRNTGNTGKAYLYLGGASGLSASASWTAAGEAGDDEFGYSVATAGDVNGDGYSDVVVGAYGNTSWTGKAYLYLGGASGLSASTSWTATGEGAGDWFGLSVATAGDVNGDGYSDVVVGAYRNTSSTGKAYLYLGGASGLSEEPSWTAAGEATGNFFGHSVATAGDVNGDGYSDVVVGAYRNTTWTGKAYLYLGGASGLSASASWTAAGEATSNSFGHSVATAGDVNGDGYSDVVVGAHGNTSWTGKAYLYLGGASGLSASTSWTAAGEAGDDEFGYSVATAGDVNGDGYSDVVVGAYGNTVDTGKAHLYLGGGDAGVSLVPRQLRADLTAPIHPGGLAFEQSFRIGLTLRSPVGRVWRKLQWQVVPWRGSFTPAVHPIQSDLFWYDDPVACSTPVNLSVDRQRYVWHARVKYHPAQSPFLPWSPWFTLSGNGLHEADVLSTSQSAPPPCVIPDEELYITTMTLDGNGKPVIHYQDPNQPDFVTGYNVYRAPTATGPWTQLASNVVDMDEGTPDIQYVDQTGDVGGPWYYEVAAWNDACGAEGPY